MTSTVLPTQQALVPTPPAPDIVISPKCVILEVGEERVAYVCGVPVFRYHVGDAVAEKLFVAQALEAGFAKPGELAAGLSLSLRTIHRDRKKYVDGGVAELLPKKPGPRGPRLGEAREAAIRVWHGEGLSGREMARRLGVSPSTVGLALDRLGLPKGRRGPQQVALPSPPDGGTAVAPAETTAEKAGDARSATAPIEPSEVDGAAEAEAGAEEARPFLPVSSTALPVETTLDPDPMNREIDRMLAVQGEINDAAPLFAPGKGLPRAGVLLAVPLVMASGVFQAGRETYGHIGPAFYGLRTTLLTLLLLALLRIKRPENVKEYSPPELGRFMGLDRAPEVKTIRRKLFRLAEGGRAQAFLDKLVKSRVESRSEALGFLYVDGHVRVYSGKADLPKTHVARMRISLPATQDVWVNDADGAPLFFVTQEAHPSLVGALSPLLGEIRELVGPERRVTVVFDRGGWSPKLFQKMDQAGFDVLTYRKGKSDPVPDDEFKEYVVPGTQGKKQYLLHDTEVPLLKGKFSMRQVTRRKADHQTKIVTTRKDLSVMQVALRMFHRWRQENFFKYMREEYALDALVEHGVEAADPSRLVPNPTRKEMDKRVRKARREVERLEAEYGAAAIDNPERKRRTMRGFKIAHGTEIGVPLRQARARVEELVEQRSKVSTHVPVGEVRDEVVRLPRDKKQLTDGLKMLAHQVETDLVRVVAPFYARSLDEGRTLVTAALQSAADLEVAGDELRVTLAAQSSPHRSRAIAELCVLLNATETVFPGTSLRLHYAVAGVESVT